MNKQIEIDMYAGALVFWNSTMSSLSALHRATEACKVSAYWLPISDAKALELALGDFYSRKKKLIRATMPVFKNGKSSPAFVVVNEEQNSSTNEYASERKYWIDSDTYEVFFADASDMDEKPASHINAKQYQGKVRGAHVGFGMESVVRSVGGYRLREGARVYYIPQARMERWAEVIECFSREIGAQFFQVNCPQDTETATAVAQAATEDIRERYQAIIDAIEKIDLDADSETTDSKRKRIQAKRVELLSRLEAIKNEAALIDQSFSGLLSLAESIGEEIETAMAVAVLNTSL